jgi:tetratricopeptide (TPR) repeat protein
VKELLWTTDLLMKNEVKCCSSGCQVAGSKKSRALLRARLFLCLPDAPGGRCIVSCIAGSGPQRLLVILCMIRRICLIHRDSSFVVSVMLFDLHCALRLMGKLEIAKHMIHDSHRDTGCVIRTAISLSRNGRDADALRMLSIAIDNSHLSDELRIRALLQRAKVWYLEGRPQHAIADLECVIQSEFACASQRGAAYLTLADCYEETGNPKAVVDALLNATRLRSVSGAQAAATMHNFGVRCNLRGQPEKGFVYFDAVCRKEAVAASGIFFNAVINRGCYLGDLGYYGLAEDDFRRVIEYPNVSAEYFARAQYNLGHMHWILGEYDSAIDAFVKAIESDAIPDSMRLLAQCKRAHCHQRAGRVEIALGLLGECLPFPEVQSRSDYETLLFYAGATLLGARKHADAEELFAKTAAIRGCSALMKARSLWSLGYSQCMRGRSSEGILLMLKARETLSSLKESRFLELIDRDLQRFTDPGS